MENEKNQFVETELLGTSIQWIKRTCNLIMIHMQKDYDMVFSLHIESFVRVIKKSITILCSNDMFFPGKRAPKHRFRWDKPFMTLFDDSLESIQKDIFNQRIVKVFSTNKELHLHLQNGVEIQVIPDTVEEGEAYRLFTGSKDLYICNSP